MESSKNKKVSPEVNKDSTGVNKETTQVYRVLNLHMGYIRYKEAAKKEKELYYSLGHFTFATHKYNTKILAKRTHCAQAVISMGHRHGKSYNHD